MGILFHCDPEYIFSSSARSFLDWMVTVYPKNLPPPYIYDLSDGFHSPTISFEYDIPHFRNGADLHSALNFEVNMRTGKTHFFQLFNDEGRVRDDLFIFNDNDRRWIFDQIAKWTLSVPACMIQ